MEKDAVSRNPPIGGTVQSPAINSREAGLSISEVPWLIHFTFEHARLQVIVFDMGLPKVVAFLAALLLGCQVRSNLVYGRPGQR